MGIQYIVEKRDLLGQDFIKYNIKNSAKLPALATITLVSDTRIDVT